jgi:hypothetical protein
MTQDSFVLPLGYAADYLPGESEVIVLRHSDPVQIRRPGSAVGFPMRFYEKRLRVGSGGWVISGDGGRVEIMVPGSSTTIHVFDSGSIFIGEPTRAEPLLTLVHCDRASIRLAPGHRVALVGGIELEADPNIEGGPYDFRTHGRDRIEISNHGRSVGKLLFRDQELSLGPGEIMELPILVGGSGPLPRGPKPFFLAVSRGTWAGNAPFAIGQVVLVDDPRGLRLRAEEPSDVTALGVRVHLSEGEEVLFQRLDEVRVVSNPE